MACMAAIAVFEDDILMRSLITEWLAAEGHVVSGCRNDGAPACKSPELLIVGVYMPRHSGIDQLHYARNRHPGVPIIAMSGQFRPHVDHAGSAARALGVDRVIAKPMSRDALLGAVQSVIGD